jgi:hypothetical protein
MAGASVVLCRAPTGRTCPGQRKAMRQRALVGCEGTLAWFCRCSRACLDRLREDAGHTAVPKPVSALSRARLSTPPGFTLT